MQKRLAANFAWIGMWLIVELGRLAVRIFPRRLLFFLAEAIATAGFHLFRTFRRRCSANLSLAMGERLQAQEVEEVVRRSLSNFFRAFIEVGVTLASSPEEIRHEVPLRGREHLEAALARGKGVVALGAHLGNFFLVGSRLAVDGYSTHVLVNQTQNRALAKLMDRYRLAVWQKTIHARPRRIASQSLVQVLRGNEIAVVIADEYRDGSGIHVPFFGRQVLARRGPATLALRTGAAVVPIYMVRDGTGRLTLVIEPEIELERSVTTRAAIQENVLRITQWLERVVRAYPDQWNWMNIRWQEPVLGGLAQKKPAAKASIA